MAKQIFSLISAIFRRQLGVPMVLTKIEFAALLKVECKDVDKAIKYGQLVPGRHFFLINNKERFYPTDNLFRSIMDDCNQAAKFAQTISANVQTPTVSRRCSKVNKTTRVAESAK